MTTQTEALKLALEALENLEEHLPGDWAFDVLESFSGKDEYRKDLARARSLIPTIKEALSEPEPEQEPVAHPFEDKAVISSLSWAAGLIEQAYRACGGHNGADSWLMNYADKQGERIRQADHREWEKVNGRWQVKVTPPQRKPLTETQINDRARAEGAHNADFWLGVRFAEAAHNIKEMNNE